MVLGFLPFPGLAFNFLFLICHNSSSSSFASHTCSTSLASFLSSLLLLLLFLLFHSPPTGRSGLAASYLSVKALVPQMPKLLKSLFPARDDKKELRPSPHNQQVSRGSSNEAQCRAGRRRCYLTQWTCSRIIIIKSNLFIEHILKTTKEIRLDKSLGWKKAGSSHWFFPVYQKNQCQIYTHSLRGTPGPYRKHYSQRWLHTSGLQFWP